MDSPSDGARGRPRPRRAVPPEPGTRRHPDADGVRRGDRGEHGERTGEPARPAPGARPRGVHPEAPGPRRRILRTAPDAEPRDRARVRRQPPPEHRRRDVDPSARDPRRRVPPPQEPGARRRATPEAVDPARPRRGDAPMGRRSSGEIHTRSASVDPTRGRRPRPDAEGRRVAADRADRPHGDDVTKVKKVAPAADAPRRTPGAKNTTKKSTRRTPPNSASSAAAEIAGSAGGDDDHAARRPPRKTAAKKTPGSKAPGAKAPGAKAPGVKAPGAKAPGAKAPGAKAPGAKAPGAKAPGVKAPGSNASGARTSGAQAPTAEATVDTSPPGKNTSRKSQRAAARPGDPTAEKRRPTAGATRAAAAADLADVPSTDSTTESTTPPTDTGTGLRTGRDWASGASWGRALIALASVAVLLCTGYAWNTMTGLDSRITQLGGLGLGGAADGAVDILLVGTDSRTDAQGNPLSPEEMKLLRSGDEVATNTDTILLVRIPEDGSSATAISIPRDSYVDVPGIGKSKINAAYGTTREGVRARAVESGASPEEAEKQGTLAGRKALVDTVANLTGVQVDHYAEVGLLGFVLLTNAVGGVDVCLKAPVRDPYSGARFRAGIQTLDGPKALSFVRQRHGLPRGDLDRITRQQAFMASLTQKVLSAGTLTDPGKLSEMQDAVARSIVIDDGWNIIDFAEQLKDLSGGKVKFATIPIVTEQGWSEDGQQSVVEVDPQAVKVFTDELLTPKKTDDVARGDYKVDVVNAGTIDGLGANVSNILTTKGFQPGQTSSGKADTKDSIVYAKENNDAARLLAKDLGGVRIVADPSLADDQLKVVLTNTYDGPGSISDVGDQADNVPASERVGNKRPPITAGNKGPMCVN
ncbi:LCP family glycopolymer transferase [Gordonia aurantiaca]|uniref:LCP family glycopolymer transferase n=1 Tax=Gordonia sp. B21 TaxID=3151852 RepID=UPI003263A44C